MKLEQYVVSEWRCAWRWASVRLGGLIAVAPAIYEYSDAFQALMPREAFVVVQAVLGAAVIANAVKKKS